MEIKQFDLEFLRVREFEKGLGGKLYEILQNLKGKRIEFINKVPPLGNLFAISNFLILGFSMFISLDKSNFFDVNFLIK